jgi:hypothetical protein
MREYKEISEVRKIYEYFFPVSVINGIKIVENVCHPILLDHSGGIYSKWPGE